MTELTREARRTETLRKILPLYETIELTVDSLSDGVRCSVPLNPQNSNHFGAMHAGVLFSLAEVTAAQALSSHPQFRSMLVIAKDVSIRFMRPATTRTEGRSRLSNEAAEKYAEAREANPKASISIPVQLFDAEDRIVAEADACFALRQNG